MLPGSVTQNSLVPPSITGTEYKRRADSLEKMTLQLLKESIGGDCPDLYDLNATQKECYTNDLLNLYLSSIPDSAVVGENLRIPLSNNLIFNAENNGNGMVLTIGDEIDIVENIKIEAIPEMIRRLLLKYVDFFINTDLYSVANSGAMAQETQDTQKTMKIFIEEKHKELDILANAHPEIKQPCFMIAEYLRSGATDPENFKLPASLQQIAEMGLQIDFGCLFSGEENEVSIGSIAAQTYASVKNKTSLLIRAAEKDLKENVDEVCDYIKNTYPQSCILKVGGNVGHYSYYDVQKDILFSGGKDAYDNGMSGLGLREYFARKFNSDNTDYKVTLTLTDHDAEEMLDVADIVSEETGIPREEFLK